MLPGPLGGSLGPGPSDPLGSAKVDQKAHEKGPLGRCAGVEAGTHLVVSRRTGRFLA